MQFKKLYSNDNFRCPFEGLHSCPNVTVTNDVIDMLPLGQYRTIFTGQDKDDSKIYQLNITFMISLVKES